ncbi:LLM class flavin-dependent oxidoreductase [Chryseobacterium sp. H3056]|jgi:probable LLM family oxidoreductase|uniref:LLM class flavin-dependent oxidoreductase n=1 Tax=Kaistella daneshvariae TaxID=2487074 RepID=A0A3N0WVL1_9FLAO|nr:LLM class flavin-dependent oxidoreductase [Kaistella daneshvariae]ROI09005.1 LLM class flavin-dependent oxidoreductase [Kaistella daneshvariae]
MKKLEFGLMTFADVAPETVAGKGINAHQRIQNLLEEIKLADELGIDVFGIGEHHRPDYAVSSPTTVLAAAAAITKNIKLSSAVTVLSSEDPVRVYQQFATVDAISSGRAEIMAGRGSFIESFPLFGFDLKDYDELFEEKLDLLLQINHSEKVNWSGKLRAPIHDLGVYPRALNGEIPVWLAAGGTPASAVRAAKLHLPLMLAIIGGMPRQFTSFIDLYKKSALQNGVKPEDLQVGINNHMFIGEDGEKAADDFFPHYAQMMDRVGRSRGWQPMTRHQFEYMRAPEGSLMVGSVEQVVEKIVYEHQLFGFTRFFAQASLGFVPHEMTMKSIELFGTKVIPEVKRRLEIN